MSAFVPTDRMTRALKVIETWNTARHRSPNQTELAKALGVNRGTVAADLAALKAAGFLQSSPNRQLWLTGLAEDYLHPSGPSSRVSWWRRLARRLRRRLLGQ